MSLNNFEVIKHSAAVHISNNITLMQRRMWNIMLANAFNDLMEKEYYTISVKKLFETLEYNSNNISHIKESLESLVTTKINWNVFHKDGKNEWGVTSLLSGASISDGVVKYSYSYELREKLYNPIMYTRLSLIIQNFFSSKYSLCLYELFSDYCDKKRNYGESHWISINELRFFLGLLENEYQRYTDLNHYILKKSISEINEVSDLFVEYKTKRVKSKIVAIKFFINKNKSDTSSDSSSDTSSDSSSDTSSDSSSDSSIDVEFKDVDNREQCTGVYKSLINEYGVEINLALKLIKEYGEEQISKNIFYVKNYKTKIDNISGLLVNAIKNNWQLSPSTPTNKNQDSQNINLSNPIVDNIESIKSDLNLKRKDKVLSLYSELSEEQKETLKDEFIKKIESGAFGPFLMKSFKTKGFNGPGVNLQFYSVFLQNKFIENSLDDELDLYMQNINNL